MTDDSVSKIAPVDSVTSSLIDRARNRDDAAWAKLVSIYAPLVYWWGRQRGLEPEDAKDVGQEVFTTLAGCLVRFKRDKPGDSLRAYLRTIFGSKVADYWRKNKNQDKGKGGSEMRELIELVPAPEIESAQEATTEETTILYDQILAFLKQEFPDKHLRAFVMVVSEGRSSADVAVELGLTRNQVYLAKSRILRAIRKEFEVP